MCTSPARGLVCTPVIGRAARHPLPELADAHLLGVGAEGVEVGVEAGAAEPPLVEEPQRAAALEGEGEPVPLGLAGPLVVAGVLFDYGALRGSRVRPLAALNDSKQVAVEEREVLFETPTGVDVRDGVLSVPAHAGALLGSVTTFS